MTGSRIANLVPLLVLLATLLACKQLGRLEDDEKKRAVQGAPSAVVTAPPVATPSASNRSPEPAPGEVVDLTRDAIVAIESSSEKEKHPARNLFDQDPKTAWVEDSPSDGEGHFVEVKLVAGTYVAFVEVSAGWGSETRFNEDLWELNNSARIMKVSWDSGESQVSFLRSTDRAKKKRIDVNAKTDKLRFTAERIARGKFNDLAIDDFNLYGVIGR